MTASLYLQVCVTNTQLPPRKALKWRAENIRAGGSVEQRMSRRTAERPACFSHPFYEVSHSLPRLAWVTMNSWNRCGNKCYIMHLSIKHVWMYFVKTNCDNMNKGRLLVYIDFLLLNQSRRMKNKKKVIMKEIILHASICVCQPAAAYSWRK